MNSLSFSLRQLQYAVAVADTLHFGRAAKLCAVSQPSLSAQLAELERQLGVQLFDRTAKKVVVTAAGEPLLQRARALLRDATELATAAKQSQDPLAGTLRVGVIPTISPYLLPQLTPALRRAFPRLTVHWYEERTAPLLDLLRAGTIEAAVLALPADLGDGVEHIELGIDEFVLAAPRGHQLAKPGERPAHTTELRGEDVLLLDDGHCFRDQALAFCNDARAHELAFRATSLSTLAQMVANGSGVTLLPQMSVPTETRRARLQVRRFKSPAPHRTVVLAWRRGASIAPTLRQVAETMRESMAV